MAKKKPKKLLALEAEVQSIRRRCRGARAKEVAIEGETIDVDGAIQDLLAKGEHAETRELDNAARQVCGFDFNEIVLSGPLDGQVHEYTCPGCGQTGTYKAPLAQ